MQKIPISKLASSLSPGSQVRFLSFWTEAMLQSLLFSGPRDPHGEGVAEAEGLFVVCHLFAAAVGILEKNSNQFGYVIAHPLFSTTHHQ